MLGGGGGGPAACLWMPLDVDGLIDLGTETVWMSGGCDHCCCSVTASIWLLSSSF